jgi:hypothetical protein
MMSPAEKEARAMIAEKKMQKANTKAFDRADQTPPAPMPMPPRPRPQAMAAPEEGTAVMKKGGSVSSASKRADGCATKGKTKGRFV